MAWPWLSGRVTIPWDAQAQFLPQLQFLASSFAKGENPAWAPYVFSGHPQIADAQSLIFSPPFVLLALFDSAPTGHAMDVTLYLLVLMSGAALLLWFADRGWHVAGGLIAALAFMFGAAMAWRVQHIGQVMSLAYLPPALLFLDRALIRRSIVYGVLAGATAALLVIGRDQVALLSVYFLIAFVADYLLRSADWKNALRGAIAPATAAGVTGLTLIAVPIVLTYLLSQDSNRPSIDLISAGKGSLPPPLALTAFAANIFNAGHGEFWGPPSAIWKVPELYIAQNMGVYYAGTLPLLLVIWGLVTGRLWTREIRLFTLGAVASLLYTFGRYTPAFGWIYTLLPGVKLYRRPADAVFHFGFFMAVMAGYALHRLMTDGEVRLSRLQQLVIAAIPAAALLTLLAFAVHFDRLGEAVPQIALAVILFMSSAALLRFARMWRGLHPVWVAALLTAFTAADLMHGNGLNGATGESPATFDVLDPETKNETIALLRAKTAQGASDTRRDRVELVGFGFHWPNASLTHRLENTLGYNPVRVGLYSRATGAGDQSGLPEQKGFSPLFPSYRSTLADLLGLRFIATQVPIETIDKALQPRDLPLIAKTADGFVYENPRAMPRVFFATGALAADFSSMLETGQWPKADLANTVLLEAAPPQVSRRPGTVRIVSYANTRVELEAGSADGGWVVLNDVWQPWWRAFLDSNEVPLLRANVLFRAVEVPAGRHRIVFEFAPVRGAMKQLLGQRAK